MPHRVVTPRQFARPLTSIRVDRWMAMAATSLVLGASGAAAIGAAGCTQADDDDAHLLAAQGRDTVDRPVTPALVGTTPKRTRTAVAMLFDISAGPPDTAAITTLLTGPGTSLTHMYNEISYGLQQLQVDIMGPYTLPVANCLTIACCGPTSDRTGNGATVTADIAALPKTYDHYFWDYGKIPAGANCGTWGDEGSPARPAVYSSYSFQGITGQAQELGHNLGMTHEPTLTCAGGKTFLDDSTQCTHVEYGSTLSFMGMGGVGYHPSAYHKYAQGWIGGCNVVKVGASGSFNLVPQEVACNGAQLLQVAAPKVRPAPAVGDRQGQGAMLSNYYLEMRTPIGFDVRVKQPMVVISIGADLPTTNQAAPYLYVLDMTPEAGRADLSNAGLLTVGQSYTDPGGGVTFTLTSISPTTATVNVTTTAIGANTCVDATPFTAPGMDGTSCAALVGADGGTTIGTIDAGTTTGTGGRAGGTGGAGGTRGTGGTTGGGTGGAGVLGSGGTTGTTGTGGVTTTGTGGAGGATGTPRGTGGATTGPGASGSIQSGCSCSTSPTTPLSGAGGVFSSLIGGTVLLSARRRRRSRRGDS